MRTAMSLTGSETLIDNSKSKTWLDPSVDEALGQSIHLVVQKGPLVEPFAKQDIDASAVNGGKVRSL
jgi:hypothetical protein